MADNHACCGSSHAGLPQLQASTACGSGQLNLKTQIEAEKEI
jgi:hypothetical protein